MSHALHRLGRFAARRPWLVIGSWVLVAIVVIATSGAFGREFDDSFGAPGLDSQAAADLLTRSASDHAGPTAQLVLTPRAERVTFLDSAEARAALAAVQGAAAALPHVVGTSDPADRGSISPDGRVALVVVQYEVVDELSAADLRNLKALAAEAGQGSPLKVEARGDLFFSFEEPETGTGEKIGLAVAVVVLLVAFGSVVATGLPLTLALFGLGIGISAMSLVALVIDVPSFAPVIASMVGLGVGIDYALFVVTRHREGLAAGLSVEESVGRAVATAGQAVVFAGGTVVVAILGLAVAGIPFVTAAAVAISLVVLVMVTAAVTLLPALLGLAGQSVLGFGRRRARVAERERRRPAGQGWRRWATHVARHPWTYAVGTTALLLALTAPVLALRLGTPDDGTLPDSRTERRAYDLIAEGFGPGINGPLVVAIDISKAPGVVEPLAAAIASDGGIAAVGPAEIDTEVGVATIVAFPTTAPQDGATLETIRRLRAVVLPRVLDGTPATAHVGGQTATFADVGERVADRLPFFIAAVVLLSFLLLVVVFRSVLVPLKAALLNLLSIGSAYGVLVAVFQWGWGGSLIGLESTVPIVSFIPMFMFALLFGLSMDYEVFLLARVREEYRATGDSDAAVVHGLASTARVIASAALIMISVFFGFVLGDDPSVKMMGLGLAVAIFVDATLVRLVLVPATMALMGRANWWLPAWLDRLLPAIDIEGGVRLEEGWAVAVPDDTGDSGVTNGSPGVHEMSHTASSDAP